MLTAVELSTLIDRIYAAAEQSDGWLEPLELICRGLKAKGCHLFDYHGVDHSFAVVRFAGTDPAAMQVYQEHFHRVDPWAEAMPVMSMPIGQVLPGYAVLSHGGVSRTEYYADFGRQFGLTRSLFGVAGDSADGTRSAISLNRADDQPEFDDDAVAFLSLLMPHLGRALQMQGRWRAAYQRAEVALDALDALPCGVLLVDGDARVCVANTRGSTILGKRDGLASDDGRLRGESPAATKRLRDLCAAIGASRAEVPRHAGSSLAMPRRASAAPLQVLIAPVWTRGACAVPNRDVVAVVYVNDPEEPVVLDDAVLRSTFGLTPAEARVAAMLATGRSVAEIATRFAYTRETVRWYVKQVLAKADCRTQTEFAALTARSIAMLRTRSA